MKNLAIVVLLVTALSACSSSSSGGGDSIKNKLAAVEQTLQNTLAAQKRRAANVVFAGLGGDFAVTNILAASDSFSGVAAGDSVVFAPVNKPAASAHGWVGKRYSSGSEHVAAVYTNQGPPQPTTVKEAGHTYRGDGTLAINNWTDELVASPSFEKITSGSKTFPKDTKILGTFDKIPGTYTCFENTCTAVKTAAGYGMRGSWNFTPLANTFNKPNEDYAAFGWWQHRNRLAVFTAPVGNTAIAAVKSSLAGSAAYTGAAVGKYAVVGDAPDAGDFTASIALNAVFGVNDTITGTVQNFTGEDNKGRNWRVDFVESQIGPDGSFDGGLTQWTIDNKKSAPAGNWAGQFYNNIPEGEDLAGTPSTVIGTFNTGHGAYARMAGAFGAANGY